VSKESFSIRRPAGAYIWLRREVRSVSATVLSRVPMRLIGLVVVAFSIFLAPLAAGAQQTGKVPRIAVLTTSSPPGTFATDEFVRGVISATSKAGTSTSSGAGDTAPPNGSPNTRPTSCVSTST
jgi:hypothetical protein